LLAGLNQVLHIDAAARKAIVQPVVSNRDLLAALQPHGLAFPSVHCPQVKVSGYRHRQPCRLLPLRMAASFSWSPPLPSLIRTTTAGSSWHL
jgi:hypothetical protein